MTDCLFIVDVQRGFLNRSTAHVPARVAALQDEYENILVTRFVNPPGSMHRRLIGWERFAPDSEDTALAFVPRRGVRSVEKSTYTCLVPEVESWLRAIGSSRVFLCGIATDNCVLKTAVDLFERDIEPLVLVDACGSHGGPECHEAGLMLLRRFIGAGQLVGGP